MKRPAEWTQLHLTLDSSFRFGEHSIHIGEEKVEELEDCKTQWEWPVTRILLLPPQVRWMSIL